jgi:DNA-binding transcriptional regulator LsrR (DeoR family)
MISARELEDIRACGAVCDTLGRLFDADGVEVDHEICRRTVAVEPATLRDKQVVLTAGELEKVNSIHALLRAHIVCGLITDGDTALALASSL